jgi:hypothetical protein
MSLNLMKRSCLWNPGTVSRTADSLLCRRRQDRLGRLVSASHRSDLWLCRRMKSSKLAAFALFSPTKVITAAEQFVATKSERQMIKCRVAQGSLIPEDSKRPRFCQRTSSYASLRGDRRAESTIPPLNDSGRRPPN